MKGFARIAGLLFVPALLIIGAFLYLKTRNLSPVAYTVTIYSPYVLFFSTAVISWWFKKSRVFFSILILLFSLLLLIYDLPESSNVSFYTEQAYSFAAVFIPLNILIFSFLKERGILTIWGIVKFTFIAVQAFFFIWFTGDEGGSISNYLSANFILKDIKIFELVPQSILIVVIASAVFLFIKGVRDRSYIDMGLFTAIIMTSAAILKKGSNLTLSVLFGFSALTLLISVVQDSYSLAFMDELTGIPSRRALKHEMMKLSGKYTIAMLDIDFFKKFNDKYGHDVGDQVLKMVSSVMMNVTGGGKVFRYGGEEFTVLFAGKGLSEAIPHLESLREDISKRGFTQRSKARPKNKPKNYKAKSAQGKQLFVTVSIGAAEKNDKQKLSEEVIKAADKALYRAKKKGRNCVSK